MKLIPGNSYTLKYSRQFSHAIGRNGYVNFSEWMNDEDRAEGIFIGRVPVGIDGALRNIFAIKNDWDTDRDPCIYEFLNGKT